MRVYHGISENRILLVAAGVTFYSLLAIFPATKSKSLQLTKTISEERTEIHQALAQRRMLGPFPAGGKPGRAAASICAHQRAPRRVLTGGPKGRTH